MHPRLPAPSSLVNSSALGGLLISKGIITEEEYSAAVADGMESERDSYARYLSEHFGKDVTLR